MIVLYIIWSIENARPTARDLNRYVMEHATKWKDIGIELGLQTATLNIIEKDHPLDSVECFKKALNKWLDFDINATWKKLEVALTNVNRAILGLGPVDDIYDIS